MLGVVGIIRCNRLWTMVLWLWHMGMFSPCRGYVTKSE